MSERSHIPTASTPDALRRYLGADLADRLLSGSAREQDYFAAVAHLASVRYALTTYLPRRLLQHQLQDQCPQPWLEWVEGTLLFADVSGSTALAERLSTLGREGTEIVTDTLNCYFGTMIRSIQRAGGDLITFGGDALLVLFEGANHTHVATATALNLLRELSDFQRHVPGIGTFPLSMHIGVERGRVALVSAGQPQALRYSAMGHTVNCVALAEGYGGRGELVLGPLAWPIVAAEAQGEEVTSGYVRVQDLQSAATITPAPLDEPISSFDLNAITRLITQIDQLSPYLPPSLMLRILADPQRPVVEADLRPVTVLFAQVIGLSTLVEQLPAHHAAAAVDAFLQPIQAAVQQYGGFVNKLDLAEEGDKLLAIFGAPIAYEDHAERAARAAMAMQAILQGEQLSKTILGQFPPLQLRIGLNTGNVFAGNVGTPERKEYTVMGDAVNVAARVMVKTAWGEIRCSAATATLISHSLQCEDPQHVAVKGKAEPLELLRLVGERQVNQQELAQRTPLVGRERELTWLHAHVAAMLNGSGRVVRVSGEAGIGKTRLVGELLDAYPHLHTIHVRCLSFNTNTPYSPWAELLSTICGVEPTDDHTTRVSRLSTALDASNIPSDDWLPLLAELLRIEISDSAIIRALDPQQRQVRRFEIITSLVHTVARTERGLLILFDNLHWADQVSLDLWQYLAANLADMPIILLGLHRGELNWGGGPQGDGAEELDLGRLADGDCSILLTSLASDQRLSDELRYQIIARAGGNPLFLEELLHALRSSNTALDALPDSLSGLLLARIDRLNERARALLRVAAVIGQRFPLGVLRAIYLEEQSALLHQLADLDAQELTRLEREIPDRIHLFRHGLMQEVIYQSLLYARRRELHRRIGEHLEQQYKHELAQVNAEYGDASREYLVQIGRNGSLLSRTARANGNTIFLLAHHYRNSDRPDRAVPYLLLSGHIARDDYANEQALQFYQWALEALGDAAFGPQVWEAREAMGDVLCTLGHYDQAQQEYAALLVATDTPLPSAVAAEVLRSWGDALEKQGSYAEALEKLRQAEAICQQALNSVPPLLLSAIYADMGMVLFRLGEYEQALSICQTGLAKIRNDRRSAEDERIEADLQRQIGTIHAMRGQYDQARFHFENALAAQEEIDDLFGCSRSHNNLGYLAQLESDYERAVGHYEQAQELARKVQSKYVLSSVLLNLADSYCRLDRYAEAEYTCKEALALFQEMGDRDGIAKVYDTLGLIDDSRGEYSQALAHYQTALGLHRELDSSYQEGNTLAMIAAMHNALSNPVQARELAQQAYVIGERIQAPQLLVEALIALAEADLRSAALTEAAAQATQAATLAEQIGSRANYGTARRLLGQISAAQGDAAADEHFLAAEATFQQIQSRLELARTWATYGEYLYTRNATGATAYLIQAEETFRRIEANAELRHLINYHNSQQRQE
ncbi:adenylyl cyclase class-3/4/guanylyl cyclase [Oscillochloris trichoides DG-6]|uniref:Adenylyl cyclase class-3/4/guanylyl cyclase n=1 Tax=Oscillochloris trichoides DG-6 TaxID=765420 RepID=E1ICR1_9CHLR|nr:adenylate/guanylate cyclase domain-containing protein [Oscillochloris trichoides]EFO81009.1 adenylyl cyclase class-3/4/guanylyl cyclase [Oscillochloris trichoides DG-6]